MDYDPKDHFLGITKMVDLGSGAKRERIIFKQVPYEVTAT